MLEILDNTTIDNFQTCMRKGYFRHVRHLEPLRKGTALVFGQAIHAGCEARNILYKEGSDHSLEVIKAEEEAAIKAYHNTLYTEGYADLLASLSKPETLRTPEKGEAVLRYYFKIEPFPPAFNIVSVEEGFKIVLGEVNGRSVIWLGRIDLIYELEGRGLVARDYKTTSWQPPLAKPNRQMTGYQYALVDHYGKDKVFAVEIFGMKVPRGNGSHECTAVKAMYGDIERELWRRETLQLVEHIDACFASGIWPQNTGSCRKFNTLCPYYSLCSQRVEPQKAYIDETEFAEKPWNPLERLELADE